MIPARIDRILRKLRRLWLAHPDLRLTQLAWMCAKDASPCPSFYYTEDDVVEAEMDELLRDEKEFGDE